MGGHKRLSVMIGAKDFIAIEKGLQFKFKMSKWNCVNIVLNDSDTYTMKFCQIKGYNLKEGPEIKDVYFDKLQSIFTENTGLVIHL